MLKKLKDKKGKVGKQAMKDFKKSLKKFKTAKVTKHIGKLDLDLCDNETLLNAYSSLLLDKE